MKDVYFDFGCFATILSSVVESYTKETYGFVGGEDTKMRVNLKMSLPLQSAVKTNTSVEFKEKKYEEAKGVIDALGLTIVGGFHSHPKGIAYPSEQDKISAELENLNKRVDPSSPFMDKWLEIVVGLHKKKYMKNFKPTATLDDSSKKIEGRLNLVSYHF